MLFACVLVFICKAGTAVNFVKCFAFFVRKAPYMYQSTLLSEAVQSRTGSC